MEIYILKNMEPTNKLHESSISSSTRILSYSTFSLCPMMTVRLLYICPHHTFTQSQSHLDNIKHVRAIHVTIRDPTNFTIIRLILMTYFLYLILTLFDIIFVFHTKMDQVLAALENPMNVGNPLKYC